MKILMVCLGNICRSPLAEGILKHKALAAGLSWTVDSAGTNGYHVGESPHPLSQKVALLHGIDISHQRARRFTAEDFGEYDKIYALAEDVIRDMRHVTKKKFDGTRVNLLMNEKYPGENIDIPDPYYGHEMGYHQAYEMIDEACEAIIQKYKTP
jgi:protein-tyrosine phosphatase